MIPDDLDRCGTQKFIQAELYATHLQTTVFVHPYQLTAHGFHRVGPQCGAELHWYRLSIWDSGLVRDFGKGAKGCFYDGGAGSGTQIHPFTDWQLRVFLLDQPVIELHGLHAPHVFLHHGLEVTARGSKGIALQLVFRAAFDQADDALQLLGAAKLLGNRGQALDL